MERRIVMEETIISINTLPELLFSRTHCERVKVWENDGLFSVVPVKEKKGRSLRGLTQGSGLTVEKFLAMTREDKESEQ